MEAHKMDKVMGAVSSPPSDNKHSTKKPANSTTGTNNNKDNKDSKEGSHALGQPSHPDFATTNKLILPNIVSSLDAYVDTYVDRKVHRLVHRLGNDSHNNLHTQSQVQSQGASQMQTPTAPAHNGKGVSPRSKKAHAKLQSLQQIDSITTPHSNQQQQQQQQQQHPRDDSNNSHRDAVSLLTSKDDIDTQPSAFDAHDDMYTRKSKSSKQSKRTSSSNNNNHNNNNVRMTSAGAGTSASIAAPESHDLRSVTYPGLSSSVTEESEVSCRLSVVWYLSAHTQFTHMSVRLSWILCYCVCVCVFVCVCEQQDLFESKLTFGKALEALAAIKVNDYNKKRKQKQATKYKV
jgi:hypothetical protein